MYMLGIQVSLAIYVCLSGSWLGGLPFLFSYASVLSTCVSMYLDNVVFVLLLACKGASNFCKANLSVYG